MASPRAQLLQEQDLEILRCPVTGSRLHFDAEKRFLIGETGGLRYPIRDGFPSLLAEEAQLPPGIESLEDFKKRFGRAET